MGFDVGADGGFQLGGRSMHAAADLVIGKQAKEPRPHHTSRRLSAMAGLGRLRGDQGRYAEAVELYLERSGRGAYAHVRG